MCVREFCVKTPPAQKCHPLQKLLPTPLFRICRLGYMHEAASGTDGTVGLGIRKSRHHGGLLDNVGGSGSQVDQ